MLANTYLLKECRSKHSFVPNKNWHRKVALFGNKHDLTATTEWIERDDVDESSKTHHISVNMTPTT